MKDLLVFLGMRFGVVIALIGIVILLIGLKECALFGFRRIFGIVRAEEPAEVAACELSAELRDYLSFCGMPEGRIARCTIKTRLYHDLEIDGKRAKVFIEALTNRYRVDMGSFVFRDYFPPTIYDGNVIRPVLLVVFPFLNEVLKSKANYAPLTLAMIESAIQTKKWHD